MPQCGGGPTQENSVEVWQMQSHLEKSCNDAVDVDASQKNPIVIWRCGAGNPKDSFNGMVAVEVAIPRHHV